MTTHSLERTSPPGGRFLGRCTICGAESLTSSQALELCPASKGRTDDDNLIDAIERVST